LVRDQLIGNLQDRENQLHVWMSHGDKVSAIPEGFKLLQAHQAVHLLL
jgi:GMP synthase (glutamine-hydrolysing)